MDYFSLIFWIIILLSIFYPALHKREVELQRIKLIARFQNKRKSRVITLIHRQESLSFFGIPFRKMIDIEDSEEILRAIRITPDDVPIDLILHTPGGLVLAAEQIARSLAKRKGKVTVFIPHYAMSGGTLIALAADEIVMDKNAVLGPIDPQIGTYPAVSILNVVKKKDINKVDDETLILADVSEKAIRQVKEFAIELLSDKVEEGVLSKEKAEEIAEELSSGKWTHDYPLTYERIKELGLKVSTEMPQEVYALMSLYPQSGIGRPSVQYIPLPISPKQKENK
ncbi:MAG: hypothetical protein DRI22_00340 [Caldiserica bacterium]|nr:MAG: hypothetical protein DRI22_00340 [Caldisericota bacterium]